MRSRQLPKRSTLARFEALYSDAMRADGADAVRLLDAAWPCGTVSAFGEHADVESIAPEARRLEELRRRGDEARTVALLQAGRVDEAVAAAESLVTAEPLWEGAWARLIEGLAAQGRTADALRVFQRAATALAKPASNRRTCCASASGW